MNGESHNQTASSIRYDSMVAERAYESMRYGSPEYQAEVIAKHYASHATLALQLLELLKARRYGGATENLDSAIAWTVDQIKRNHRHSFGIELEWPKLEATEFN